MFSNYDQLCASWKKGPAQTLITEGNRPLRSLGHKRALEGKPSVAPLLEGAPHAGGNSPK